MTTAVALVPSPNHWFPDHEEAPSRFRRLDHLETRFPTVEFLDPQPAPLSAVTAVHPQAMLLRFEAACRQGPGITDYAPTFVTPSTYADAFLAAGSTLTCAEIVLRGDAGNAFAIVRPPGHHAEPNAAMGFCLLNNIAIAAHHALASGVERLLIFDFDAHHGNGTQAVFRDEPRVAFFSTHQENIYPYRTGFMDEAPHARGRIVNLPLPPRTGDAGYACLVDRVLVPLVGRFKPQVIFVSAGFDSHWNDPLAELGLSSAGYHALAGRLVDLAAEACGGKLVFVLEGGYNPINVASGVEAVLCALTGTDFHPSDPSPYAEPDISGRVEALCSLHGFQS